MFGGCPPLVQTRKVSTLSEPLDDDHSQPAAEPPRSSDTRYRSGEVIAGKYELIRCLGEGGMGSVWVARNLALDAQVAVKLIRASVDSPLAAERLLTEARAAAKLKHPAIVRVFDFGRTERDDPFIVMELLAGENLGSLIGRERRLPAIYAVQLLLPIIDALHVAHANGVVHRDLKPDNIFLASFDGRVLPKVVDFGVAKVEQEGRFGTHKLTETGAVVGSPEYMAPEQAGGDDYLDHRVDIWAVSMVLYECVTGRTAFRDANYHALLRKIIEKPARSILDLGAGDALLWQIIERGLAKDPEQRWQSMLHVGKALASWLSAKDVTEDASGQALRSAWLDRRASLPAIEEPVVHESGKPARPSYQPAIDPREEGTVPGAVSLLPAPRASDRARDSSTLSSNVALAEPRARAFGALARRRLFFAAAALLLVAGGVGLGLRWAAAPTSMAAAEPEAQPAARPTASPPVVIVVPAAARDDDAGAAQPEAVPFEAVGPARSAPVRAVAAATAPQRPSKPAATAAKPAPAAKASGSAEPRKPSEGYEDLGF
jgi:serine/threonine-protein kinase